MEPPKPDLLRSLTEKGLDADYAERERKRSARFETDPSLNKPRPKTDGPSRPARIGTPTSPRKLITE